MRWVIQRALFRPQNFESLTHALRRAGVDFTAVAIGVDGLDLEPEVEPDGRVYACGGVRMARLAARRGWSPGVFLNERFNVEAWRAALGAVMLNSEVEVGPLSEIEPRASRFFIRPLEDNKAFNGRVMDAEALRALQEAGAARGRGDLPVVISPVRSILREYRVFIVRGGVVAGSLYKVAGRPEASRMVEPGVYAFVEEVIARWTPHESCVIDVALTAEGYEVIEFNCINASGFYLCDVPKYVHAVQEGYA